MVAVADRCVRKWRRNIRAGMLLSVVHEAAKEMNISLPLAEHIVTTITSQRNRAYKETSARLKEKAHEETT